MRRVGLRPTGVDWDALQRHPQLVGLLPVPCTSGSWGVDGVVAPSKALRVYSPPTEISIGLLHPTPAEQINLPDVSYKAMQ